MGLYRVILSRRALYVSNNSAYADEYFEDISIDVIQIIELGVRILEPKPKIAKLSDYNPKLSHYMDSNKLWLAGLVLYNLFSLFCSSHCVGIQVNPPIRIVPRTISS